MKPLYFAGYFLENGRARIAWKHRADTAYYGAAVCWEGGEVCTEAQSVLLDGAPETVSLYALDAHGGRSLMAELKRAEAFALPQTLEEPNPEQVRIVSAEDGAYFCVQDAPMFIRGFNFIGLNPDHCTFEPSCYDPLTAEVMLAQLRPLGYNVVRVFIMSGRNDLDPGVSGGRAHNDGRFDPAYMANVLHFMKLCRRYGFRLLPNFGDNEIVCNRYYEAISGGCDRMQVYFSEGAVRAKAMMVEEFLRCVREEDEGLIRTLLALQMQNEFCFNENAAPFTQREGVYRLYDGSEYDMADDHQRRALAFHAAELYYSRMRDTVKRVAPGLLLCEGTFTMRAVGKSIENSYGFHSGAQDERLPFSALEYLRLPLDFLDMHVYCEDGDDAEEAFSANFRNMLLEEPEARELMRRKPVIMGEFNSFKKNRRTGDFAVARQTILGLRDSAIRHGFAGFLLWTVDTFYQQEIWHMMEDGGDFARALADTGR